jgi:hypothetical protein
MGHAARVPGPEGDRGGVERQDSGAAGAGQLDAYGLAEAVPVGVGEEVGGTVTVPALVGAGVGVGPVIVTGTVSWRVTVLNWTVRVT